MIPKIQQPNSSKDASEYTPFRNVLIGYILDGMDFVELDKRYLQTTSLKNLNYKSENILKEMGIGKDFKGFFKDKSVGYAINTLSANSNSDQYQLLIQVLRGRPFNKKSINSQQSNKVTSKVKRKKEKPSNELALYSGFSKKEIRKMLYKYNYQKIEVIITKLCSKRNRSTQKVKDYLQRAYGNYIFQGYIAVDSVTKRAVESLRNDQLLKEKAPIQNINKYNKVSKDENMVKKNGLNTKQNLTPLSKEGKIIKDIFENVDMLSYTEANSIFYQKINYYLSAKILERYGYRVSNGYVIKNRYNSYKPIILKYINESKIIDKTRSPYNKFAYFYKTLKSLEKSGKIYPINVNQYVKYSALGDAGFTNKTIVSFIYDLEKFTRNEWPFFNMYSLIKNGFNHKILELGFDNYFYENIIQKHSTKLKWINGKSLIFYNENILNTKNKLLIADFFKWHISLKGSIDYQDLVNLLSEKYGLTYTYTSIKSQTDRLGVHFSKETEKFYENIELFYEEVY